MRPIRLHVEGFGVFREPVDIDFDDAEYFAFVGPTGAGKSTIIDAICFALYGSVPRYGDERLVGRVVSVGGHEAKVSLTFDVGGARYRATRVVRIGKGKGDALLEREIPGGTEVLAARVSEMKPAVERLLGLPFAHFTKCVVLPQGDFAKFLHDEPAKRRELLTRLLDLGAYARIGERARIAAKEAAKAAELHERQLDDLAFATEDARIAAATRVEQLLDLCHALDEARPDDERDARALEAAVADASGAESLAELLGDVTVPDAVDAAGATLEAAAATHAAAVDASADASTALTAAEERAEAAGDRDILARADAAHTELAGVADQLEAAVAEETRLGAEVERAATVVVSARTNAADTQRALEAARTAHRAHALMADLVAGEPCPVCTQVVETVPRKRRPAALDKAEGAVSKAETIVAQAEGAHAQLVKMHASADASAAQFSGRRDALSTAVSDHPDHAVVVAALKAVDKAQQQLVKARAAEKKARASADASAHDVAAIEKRSAALRAEYAARRDELSRHGCELPPAGDELAPAWHELAEWARAESGVRRKAATASRKKRDALLEVRTARVASFADRARAAGVATTGSTLGDVRDDVIRDGQNARHELHRIEESIERAEKLRAEVAAARAEHDVARMLGDLLKSDRFEKWVLAEALAVLVDAASQTLQTLTQGNYSLRYSDDEEFVVVDHRNADETRSVRTLSGGETFQASLALALALSDQLAELSAAGGAKLDAIFCDEGFGSLDADTLDAVATTIESLATSGRVVGVVTHVPALAERVPVRFRVHHGTVTREES